MIEDVTPLSETELTQIEARAKKAIGFGTMPRFIDPDVPRLVAEVERLRSQNEKLFNSGLKNFDENARLRDALESIIRIGTDILLLPKSTFPHWGKAFDRADRIAREALIPAKEKPE